MTKIEKTFFSIKTFYRKSMGKRAKDKNYMFNIWRWVFNTYSKFLRFNGSVNFTDLWACTPVVLWWWVSVHSVKKGSQGLGSAVRWESPCCLGGRHSSGLVQGAFSFSVLLGSFVAREIRNCRELFHSVLMRTSLTPLFCVLEAGEGPNA